MLFNYGVGEDSRVPWTARRSNQSILKEIRYCPVGGDFVARVSLLFLSNILVLTLLVFQSPAL